MISRDGERSFCLREQVFRAIMSGRFDRHGDWFRRLGCVKSLVAGVLLKETDIMGVLTDLPVAKKKAA